MVQRLHNISKWATLEDGQVIKFNSPKKREVRLEVNSSGCELYYVAEDGTVKFLAFIRGRDVIEFITDGQFGISCDGGECSFYTADGEDVSFEVIDAVIFTSIVERRRRNPELELMELRMMQNINSRLERQRHELVDYYARRERYAAQKHEAALVAAGTGGQQEPADRTEPSDTPPAGADD